MDSLTRAQKYAENPWIVCPNPIERARLRLFCFPHAGSGPAAYQSWVTRLPADVELCPILLPGRESRLREPAFRRFPPLVRALADAIRPHLDIPFVFFGYSMGATISFELARQLRRAGERGPVHLIVCARRAPQLGDPDPPIHHLPDSELMRGLSTRYGELPDAIVRSPDILALYLAILRADLELIETYTYQDEEPLDCSIAAYGGTRDSRASEAQLAAWSEQTRGDLTVRIFPGGHFFIQESREALLAEVSAALRRLPA